MAKKISELPSATLPLEGSELVEIVQSGSNRKVATEELFIAKPPPVVNESSSSRALTASDSGAYIRHTNAGPSTVTISAQISATWPENAEIHLRRSAAADLTLTPGADVLLNAPAGGTLVLTENMTVTLKRVGLDVWDVIGQTVPA